MIPLSAEAQASLVTSHTIDWRVESWYDGRLLSSDIPFRSGIEQVDGNSDIQGRAEFRIPRIGIDGFDWTPNNSDHPLSASGQRLRVLIGVGTSGADVEWFQRGWWRIVNTTSEGDEVIVECGDLLWIVAESDFPGPFQPTGTFASTVRQLVQPEVGVLFDDDLVDRAVPDVLEFGTSRIQAFYDTLDAWPAEAFMDPLGYLNIRPLLESTTPVLTLSNGYGGTVVRASGESTAEGGWNCVRVRGKDTNGNLIQAMAYNLNPKHPKRYGGPFSKLPIMFDYQNDLIQSYDRARITALFLLARKMKQNSNQYVISAMPNPTIQIGDVLLIDVDQASNVLVEVIKLSLPYTYDGGDMTLTVRTI